MFRNACTLCLVNAPSLLCSNLGSPIDLILWEAVMLNEWVILENSSGVGYSKLLEAGHS